MWIWRCGVVIGLHKTCQLMCVWVRISCNNNGKRATSSSIICRDSGNEKGNYLMIIEMAWKILIGEGGIYSHWNALTWWEIDSIYKAFLILLPEWLAFNLFVKSKWGLICSKEKHAILCFWLVYSVNYSILGENNAIWWSLA